MKVVNKLTGPVSGFLLGGKKGALQGLANASTAFFGGPLAAAVSIGSAFIGSKGNSEARQASETALQIGEVARRAMFGEGATAGSLADAFNYGGKYGTDWEVLVVVLADHLCEALLGFYVNDTYVAYAGDGNVAGYGSQLRVSWRNGSADQTPPSVLTAQGGWSTADRLRGVAYVVFEYKADAADAKKPIWTSGRPTFLSVIRGLRLYDPRKDSTVTGGSGPHRWLDPSTREWDDNAEICRYNFDRGVYACDRVDQPTQLLVGRGLSALEAPPERIFTAANLCDETVALKAGGSERRYRASGIIAADEVFGDVAEIFAAAMGGIVIQPEGSVAVEPGHAKSPVAYITDDDLVSGTKVNFSDFRSEADEEWANTVVPNYVDPAQKWVSRAAPIRRNNADVLADGRPREAAMALRLATSPTQAQRIGEIRRRLGRLLRTASVTLGPRFCELEEGDWIVWTSARRTNGLPVQFRIESYSLGKEWRNALTLREINAACYSWSVGDEIADGTTADAQTPPDGYGVPDPGSWMLTGTTIAGADGTDQPALVFTGAVEDMYCSEVRFEYRPHVAGQADGDGWIDPVFAAPSVQERRMIVGGAVEYDGAVSYRFAGGVSGPRLILAAVTAGSFSSARGAYLLRTYDVDYPVSSTDTAISLVAFTGVIDDGRAIAFPADTLAGLASATQYGVFRDLSASIYVAAAAPAAAQFASSQYVFIGWSTTANAGGTSYPSTPTPPGGWGGGGRNPYEQEP
ncbi:phage tail protein [Sphingomonas faeni]|uniref:phage tail protein n=1 Tax=Sphingomonas faeni TaxID=185950 RepID=UPI0033637F01